MKKKVGIFLSAMSMVALLSGCDEQVNNSRNLGEIQTESLNVETADIESEEEQTTEGQTTEEQTVEEKEFAYKEENRLFFLEELGMSENRAKGAAQMLEIAGCGTIVDYEDKMDGENAYTITLINSEGKKYFTSFDTDGLIGPIKDEEGTYLYAPVE